MIFFQYKLHPRDYQIYILYKSLLYRRVFALTNKKTELEFEQRGMASLLSKFRIDYSDLTLISDITKKPQEKSTQFFKELIKEFITTDNSGNDEDPGKSHTFYGFLISQLISSFRSNNRRRLVGSPGQDQSISTTKRVSTRTIHGI